MPGQEAMGQAKSKARPATALQSLNPRKRAWLPATHELTDVIDHVLCREVEGGVVLNVVRTVAWATDDEPIAWSYYLYKLGGGRKLTGWLPSGDLKVDHPVPTSMLVTLYGHRTIIAEGNGMPLLRLQPPERPPPVASHRLEDVVDRVLYRVAGNGLAVQVVRTAAWAAEGMSWNCSVRGTTTHERIGGDLPLGEIGVNHPVPTSMIATFFVGDAAVAHGDLVPLLREHDLLTTAGPLTSQSLL